MPGFVDGKRFAEVYAGNKYCMNRVDQLVKLRTAMVGELIVEEEEKTGEYDETSMAGQAEAYELLPPIITISVPRDGNSMVDKVKVLKSWFESDVIRIELTPANVEMLHEKPPEPAESAPSSNEEDVEQPHHAEDLAASYDECPDLLAIESYAKQLRERRGNFAKIASVEVNKSRPNAYAKACVKPLLSAP